MSSSGGSRRHIVTLPAFVTTLLMAYFAPVLDWFSAHVYTDLIQRAPDHLLVRIQAHLDTTHMEATCASFHHTAALGAPPDGGL